MLCQPGAATYGECLLHVSTFATTRVALPTEIEPRLITEENSHTRLNHFAAVGRSPCLAELVNHRCTFGVRVAEKSGQQPVVPKSSAVVINLENQSYPRQLLELRAAYFHMKQCISQCGLVGMPHNCCHTTRTRQGGVHISWEGRADSPQIIIRWAFQQEVLQILNIASYACSSQDSHLRHHPSLQPETRRWCVTSAGSNHLPAVTQGPGNCWVCWAMLDMTHTVYHGRQQCQACIVMHVAARICLMSDSQTKSVPLLPRASLNVPSAFM
jgi:hypothetical protein